MSATDVELGFGWEDQDITCMSRVLLDGSYITQATVSAITRKVYNYDSGALVNSSAVTVNSTVFDALQTDGRWTKDPTGYNFRDTVPGSLLVDGDTNYQIEYTFTGSGSQKFVIIFRPHIRALLSS